MKTTITENQPNWSHGSQPCLTQWTMSHAVGGHPRWMRHSESSDKTWSTGEGNDNYFSILALNGMKRQKDMTLKDELPRSVQFSSVAQSCPTLCNPMNRSMPGLPVHHQLPEFTQTQVHRVSDAIQPSHPLSSPSPPAPNPSQSYQIR